MKKKTFVKITEGKSGKMVVRTGGNGLVILSMLQTALAKVSLDLVKPGVSLEKMADGHREAVLRAMELMLAERNGEALKTLKEMLEGLK